MEDQLDDFRSQGFVVSSLAALKPDDLKDNFKEEVILASAEEALQKDFVETLKDATSKLHQRLCCIVVDEAHTVEIWTGKR